MSYQRPSFASVDAVWSANPYTRPNYDAVDALFGYFSVGTRSTHFGIPHVVFPATGFCSTTFGAASSFLTQHATGARLTAYGTPQNIPNTVGSKSTVFGIGSIPLKASALYSAALGSPRSATVGAVLWPPVRPVQFSPAYYAFDQTVPATGAQHVRFGGAFASRYEQPVINASGVAAGFPVAVFGSPACPYNRTQVARGYSSTLCGKPFAQRAMFGAVVRFGAARGVAGQSATGNPPETLFGAPATSLAGTAAGFVCTAVGTGRVALTLRASATYRAQRWGVPASARSNTYIAYGFSRHGRIGQPIGFQRHNYPASGSAVTRCGAPSSLDTHRATHIPPVSRTGKPLMLRTPTC